LYVFDVFVHLHYQKKTERKSGMWAKDMK
jgi:hypothetical protein